jgi:hypothetical protein
VTRASPYRRLAITILGLDVATLAREMQHARRERFPSRPLNVRRERSAALDGPGWARTTEAVRQAKARSTVRAA